MSIISWLSPTKLPHGWDWKIPLFVYDKHIVERSFNRLGVCTVCMSWLSLKTKRSPRSIFFVCVCVHSICLCLLLPCRFGRRGWKHLFHKQTRCHRFAAGGLWWNCDTHPSGIAEEGGEGRERKRWMVFHDIHVFFNRHLDTNRFTLPPQNLCSYATKLQSQLHFCNQHNAT